MAYSIIEGRFYYGDVNGDYFDFEGSIDEFWGGGSFVAGEIIEPGDSRGWEFGFNSSRYSTVLIEAA